jgi:hypothetical protein
MIGEEIVHAKAQRTQRKMFRYCGAQWNFRSMQFEAILAPGRLVQWYHVALHSNRDVEGRWFTESLVIPDFTLPIQSVTLRAAAFPSVPPSLTLWFRQ